jgi:hypothetical protein
LKREKVLYRKLAFHDAAQIADRAGDTAKKEHIHSCEQILLTEVELNRGQSTKARLQVNSSRKRKITQVRYSPSCDASLG